MSVETCEHNPTTGKPTTRPASPGDCTNPATWSVGADGRWHLCDSCAALPAFRRLRSRRGIGTRKGERG